MCPKKIGFRRKIARLILPGKRISPVMAAPGGRPEQDGARTDCPPGCREPLRFRPRRHDRVLLIRALVSGTISTLALMISTQEVSVPTTGEATGGAGRSGLGMG